MTKKGKKTGADAVQAAAIGHNKATKENKAEFQKRDLEIVKQIADLNEERKQNLRDAKDMGMSKMAIRQATKEILMSQEQLEAKREVEDEKKDYVKIWQEVFGVEQQAA